jgi:hypothetical protein
VPTRLRSRGNGQFVSQDNVWSAPCLNRSNVLPRPSSGGAESVAITTGGGRNRRETVSPLVSPSAYFGEAIFGRASAPPSPIAPGAGEAPHRASPALGARDSLSGASFDIVAPTAHSWTTLNFAMASTGPGCVRMHRFAGAPSTVSSDLRAA